MHRTRPCLPRAAVSFGVFLTATLMLAVASAVFAEAPEQTPIVWGDPVDGNGPAKVWEVHGSGIGKPVWSDAKQAAKGVVLMPGETPTHIRWLVVRCAFAGSPDFQYDLATVERQLTDAEIGVFAFYERQSRGMLTQEILRLDQVALSGTHHSYWYGGVDQSFSGFLTRSTDECVGDVLARHPEAADATGLAVFYNDSIGGFAYGGLTWVPVLGPELRPMVFIPYGYYPVTVAHELGHALRLPHSNNADRDADPYDNVWDLMSHAQGLNSVFHPELGSLARSFHPFHAYTLGWLGQENVAELDALAGEDRTEAYELSPDLMLRIAIGGSRSLVVTHRPSGHADEGKRTEPAVFIDELDLDRPEPLWAQDAAVPTPTYTQTDTSYFTAGEHWTWPGQVEGRALTVEVIAVSQQSSAVRVHLGPPPPPVKVFGDHFETVFSSESAHAN